MEKHPTNKANEAAGHDVMEQVIALTKRRGFIFQGSEIYGGLAGTWDWGPLGVTLKNNIKNRWWTDFIRVRRDMYGVDAALLMNQKVWQASGHVGGFADPLVECGSCKSRYREDQLIGEYLIENQISSTSTDKVLLKIPCPKCKKIGTFSESRPFNMMFKTHVGASDDSASTSYLRPETAQGMFVNFKNIVDSFHPTLPFGMGQIGKAFRNEIAPRDFLFRTREFEQMEIEYFIREKGWEDYFEAWRNTMKDWLQSIGLDMSRVHELEVAPEDRAHYSKRTIDFEYDFPFGRKELCGLAYRTDFDLKNHSTASGVDLSYYDEETKERFIPHVIEPTFGLDRIVLALLTQAYTEDELGGEKRIYLKLPHHLAPVRLAVFPLLKNKPDLFKKAQEIFNSLDNALLRNVLGSVIFDSSGTIGKRYRRQDEIGTPYCVTVDFQTLEDNTVTLRNRDTGQQTRISVENILSQIQ